MTNPANDSEHTAIQPILYSNLERNPTTDIRGTRVIGIEKLKINRMGEKSPKLVSNPVSPLEVVDSWFNLKRL